MNDYDRLELAVLPLQDGRKVVIPLTLLAEVRQVNLSDKNPDDLGSIEWRGHNLGIDSLESFCGLESPAPEQLMTVGIFRSSSGADQPFRALAFCGLAAHDLVTANGMEPADPPAEGTFTAAAEVEGETYLVPDLSGLNYSLDKSRLH